LKEVRNILMTEVFPVLGWLILHRGIKLFAVSEIIALSARRRWRQDSKCL
jgi:hypothetical protein